MSTAYPPEGPASDERSVGQIIGDLTHNLSTLVRQELDLAKTELKTEVTRAGKGAGMLAGAGVGAHLALIFLSLAVVYLLARVMPTDLAALLVGLVWAVVAVVLGLAGKKQMALVEPLPTTTETLKEDAQWLKTRNG